MSSLHPILCLFSLLPLVHAGWTATDTVNSIFSSTDGIDWGGSIFAVLAMIFGLIICFLGYRWIYPTMIVVGFIVGGAIVAAIFEYAADDDSDWLYTGSWIGFLVGGVICGALVMFVYTAGVFIVGASGGIVLAVLAMTSFGYLIYPSHPSVIFIILVCVLGILGGLLAIKIEKPVLIVSTAFAGAWLTVWGLGYFARDYPSAVDMVRYRYKDFNDDWDWNMPAAWWGYLVGTIVLFLLGMFIQFRKTARGKQHNHPGYRRARTPRQERRRNNNNNRAGFFARVKRFIPFVGRRRT